MPSVRSVIEDQYVSILQHRWLVLAVENTRPIAPDNLIVDRINNPNSVYMAQAKQQVPCFESLIFASNRGLGQTSIVLAWAQSEGPYGSKEPLLVLRI